MQTDILIIDDEEEITSLLKIVFEKEGYRVITANSGAQALDILRERKPLVIFRDISMPGMTGLEFLAQFRTQGGSSAIVMLTALAESKIILQALRLGAIDYVTKPFKVKHLLEGLKVWKEMGQRLIAIHEADSVLMIEKQQRMLDLFRVKCNGIINDD